MTALFWRALAAFTLSFLFFYTPAHADDFLEPSQAFQLTATIQDNRQLILQFEVAPGYYMYRDRFHFSVVDQGKSQRMNADISRVIFQTGDIKYDPNFDKKMEVYHHPHRIEIPLTQTEKAFSLEVTAQGCADAGLCYPPMYYDIPIQATATGYDIALPNHSSGGVHIPSRESPIEVVEATTPPLSNSLESVDLLNANDTDIATWLDRAALWQVLGVAFVLGLVLSFTPCVLPMLPILLSLVVGSRKQSRFHSLSLTLIYVLGTSIVYTILGIAAASLGAALANWIQNPWVLSLFALFLVMFGIAMMGAYTMQMPSSVQSKLTALVNKLPAGEYGGALLMGMLSALIAGPCVAAPLAGVLLFISQTGDMFKGGGILFLLAWGQGASLILLGVSSGALLPKAGEWMNTVKQICGLLLFAAALWMISPLLPSRLVMLLWAALAIAFAYFVGTFKGYRPFPSVPTLIPKLIGMLAIVWAVLLMVGVSIGSRSVLTPLHVATEHLTFTRITSVDELNQALASSQKPVMLDFYADWCVACKEMENFTFPDPKVKQLMSNLLLLQVDVTKNTEQDRALLKRFSLFGPPGIIFFNRQGQENSAVRVVGFQSAERFAESLKKAIK